MSQDRYAHLTEPTFGTVLHETENDERGMRLIYVFAPQGEDETDQWMTTYVSLIRFTTGDVWTRAKDPGDTLEIIYDPRVDFV